MIYHFMTGHISMVPWSSQNITQRLKHKRLEPSRDNLINFQLPKGIALVEDGQGVLHSCCHYQTFKEQAYLAVQIANLACRTCQTPCSGSSPFSPAE